MSLCLCGQMQVNAAITDDGTNESVPSGMNEDMLRLIEPTYLKEVIAPSAWGSNWFVGVSGGISAFVGKPLGCGGLFDRIKPSLAISAGKWFTPEIGGRVSFQGFQFKDADMTVRDYKMVHADFLWNVASCLATDHATQRWGVIPYAGCGIIHNEDNGKRLFVINYGVMAQYHVTKRLTVNMELGGTTTFRDFDGKGASNKFGDNLFTLSAGLTFNIGKVGWKKVVDAAPYINQNKWLTDYTNELLACNQKLSKAHAEDVNVIAEMRKILEIEGLLNTYADRLAFCVDSMEYRPYPKNDYSGLNSLRARLAHKDWDGRGKPVSDGRSLEYSFHVSDSASWNKCVKDMADGSKCIGSPVLFFFKIGTSQLVDASQMANLDEIARIAKTYHLKVSVVGAADNATGTDEINTPLSKSRADFITQQLMARGVGKSMIVSKGRGGIDKYSPDAANRHTAVRLFVR